MRKARIVLCGTALCLLAACGFQLRHATELPANMRTFYISGGTSIAGDTSGNLLRYLRRDLATAETQVVDDPAKADAVLRIDSVRQVSTLLAISAQGTPLEYKVTYTVDFSLLVGNAVLIEPQALVLSRAYNYNVANAISNQEQADALSGAMAMDMAQLIVFRIQAAARSALTPPSVATVRAPVAATLQTGHL